MELKQHPDCPACGFQVFNRRYPKCKSCGAELPESIAYNESERQALLKSEVERLDKEHEQHKIAVARAEAETTQQIANAALLVSLVAVANSSGS